MHLSTLTLTNVRQFKRKTFTFKPGFNLLVGENGIGKTTILRGILSALGAPESVGEKGLRDDDIRLEVDHSGVSAVLEVDGGMVEFLYKKRLWEKATRSSRNFRRPLVLHYASNESTCSPMQEKESVTYGEYPSEPLRRGQEFLYEMDRAETRMRVSGMNIRPFGSSRTVREFVGDVLLTFSDTIDDFHWRFEPYDCAIIPPGRKSRGDDPETELETRAKAAAMRFFLERRSKRQRNNISWPEEPMVVLTPWRNSERGRKVRPPDPRDIWDSMKIDPEQLKYLHSCSVEVKLTPRISIRRDDGVLSLSQLSDGEQRLFSLFVDIARQLIIKNPRKHIGKGEAIVMVDEIDVHLHPNWQRKIVPALEDLFKGCQFIATTHSPFVIQAADRKNVIPVGRVFKHKSDNHGNSIEDIAEDVQGVDIPQQGLRARRLGLSAEKYFMLLAQLRSNPSAVNESDLQNAELEYRKASEPFTSDPAVHALLKVQLLEAQKK